MLRNSIKNFLDRLYNLYRYLHLLRCEKSTLASKKSQWRRVILTPEQKREIRSVYGNKVSNKWHRLYQSYTGVFKRDYLPEILFSTRLEPKLCPRSICKVLQDKSLVEILYASVPGLRFPKTVIVNSSGLYYDAARNVIDEATAAEAVVNWCAGEAFIIKPTLNSKDGDNVLKIKTATVNKEMVLELFRKYRMNFIVQEFVKNHPAIGKLYDRSLNTFRIMTYILNDQIYHTPVVFRVGMKKEIDDELYVGISDEGILSKVAFTYEGERYLSHPGSGIIFEGYYIPGIPLLLECAYGCHKKTPHTKFISWDFALDEEGMPILIEANMLGHSAWFPQMISGVSIFGENTEQMLELIGIRRA